MNSIHQQQPEDNIKDLFGEEAKKRIKEMAEDSKSCFFCTNTLFGKWFIPRPMAVQKVDDDGNLWFLSSKDSHKNSEIAADPNVQLLFQASKHAGFLSISGIASVSADQQKINELWDPLAKVWFTQGKDDPRISVIKVEPTEGYYWDNKHGSAIAFVKMMAGAMIGKTLDDSIEGKLNV